MLRTVDHDVGDAGLFEKQFQRTEAEGFVEQFLDQTFAFRAVQQRVFGIAKMLDDQSDLAAQGVAFKIAESRKVQFLDKLSVNGSFQSFQIVGSVVGASSLGERRCGHVPLTSGQTSWLHRGKSRPSAPNETCRLNIAHEIASLPQRCEMFPERSGVRFLFNCHNPPPCHDRAGCQDSQSWMSRQVPFDRNRWRDTKPQRSLFAVRFAFQLTTKVDFGDAGRSPRGVFHTTR